MGLIVTGVHRSGTSMVAGVLAKLGISMGEGSLMAAAPENPDGFFERIDVMQLNDSILQELGGSWQAPPILGDDNWNSVSQSTMANYRSKIEIFSGHFHDWFVKDPRISLLLPLWDRLALTNLSLIYAVRNPKDVAQSLHLRNGMSHRRALSIWWAYNQAIIANIESRDVLVIDYDIAKRSKRTTTESIATFAFRSVLASKKPNNRFESGTDQIEDHLIDSIRSGEASKSISSELSRSSGTRSLKGLSKQELEQTLDLYAQLKQSHGVVNPRLKSLRTPDWVFEELYNARVEWKLTQMITSISDELETTRIHLATQENEAKLASAAQNEELDRLKSHLITLEAERDSAQNQALLLHNEAERQRKELENIQLTSAAQNEELDRLKSHLITLEAERDTLLIRDVESSNLLEKSRESLTSLSIEILNGRREKAQLNLEKYTLNSKIHELSQHINDLSQHFTARESLSVKHISKLEKEVERLAEHLGVELIRSKSKQQEFDAITNSKGFRIISWFWKRRS
jgi:hypothetical protein